MDSRIYTLAMIVSPITMRTFFSIILIFLLASRAGIAVDQSPSGKRVPAEWEPQEAIWLQWPGRFEKVYENSFARMANVIVQYQKLHILHDSVQIKKQAEAAILNNGSDPGDKNITWHEIANDSAWMRDNGPVYIVENGEIRIQNWEFDAWGSRFGKNIPFAKDNAVPEKVASYLGIPLDNINIVHERGNLEFNGMGSVILNWSTLGDHERNPGYTRDQAKADLKKHFGVHNVVFVQGVPEGDLTNGHIDGIARFINPSTVVVADCTKTSQCKPGDDGNDKIFDDAAATIEAAGFTVIREPIEGTARYGGAIYDTNYMNWIVGNGFVIAVGFDNPKTDSAAKSRIESYYPGREVYIIEMLESWNAGGGAHCHTNDQPAFSTVHGMAL